MLQKIILSQKNEAELALSQKYVEREAKINGLGNNLVKVVVGPRRAGKSFFTLHALSKAGSFGYANFDHEELSLARDYDAIVRGIDMAYNKPEFLFFDEIQNLPRWELFVNRLQRQGRKVIVSGSNSNLLSTELSTHLTGRHLQTAIFPFSFLESLKFSGASGSEGSAWEYIQKGGYPEIYSQGAEPRQYLSTLFDAVLFKDVVRRHRVRAPQSMESLAHFLLSNPSCEANPSSLARETGIKSPLTVEKYMFHLSESFLFFSIGRHSHKASERLASSRKIYCIDTGFIAAKGVTPSPNYGKLYENAVACALFRRQFEGACRLFYWKNPQGHEVDFVIREGHGVSALVQVCYDLSGTAKEREVRALLRASRELSCKNLTVVTHDYEATEDASWFGIRGKVRFVPLWKWLAE